MRFWALQVLLALDQLLIDALFMLIGQRNHCQDAYISERERLHMPPEHRRPY